MNSPLQFFTKRSSSYNGLSILQGTYSTNWPSYFLYMPPFWINVQSQIHQNEHLDDHLLGLNKYH